MYQSNEHEIIEKYFGNLNFNGLVVDVGAYDGITYSNSRRLIEDYGWKAILIEPNKNSFNSMTSKYSDNDNVTTINIGVNSEEGFLDFFIESNDGPGCTFLSSSKDKFQKVYNTVFESCEPVECKKLVNILDENNCDRNINYLSIDTEGMDYEVVRSMDLSKYFVDLISVEYVHIDKKKLINFMSNQGYKVYSENDCNLFFVKED